MIVHSRVFSSTSGDTDPRPLRSTSTTTHRPDMRFRYRVGTQEYESDLLHRAFVNPSLPDKAYLIATSESGPVVYIILGVLLPPIAWWVGKYI